MSAETTGGFPTALLTTALALVLVLAIAWLALRLLSRAGIGGALPKGGRLRVLQSAPVGARERLVLVRFDERDYLLGVSAGSVTVLARGDASAGPTGPVEPSAADSPAAHGRRDR